MGSDRLKIFFTTDLHLGNRANQTRFLDLVDEVVDHQIDYINEKQIDVYIHGGDFFDNRNAINVKTLNRGFQILHRLERETDADIYLLKGNHDYYYRTNKDFSSADPLQDINKDRIHVISEVKGVDWLGNKILLVPWLMPSDANPFLDIIKKERWDICFGHFEIKGFDLNVSGFKNRAGFDSKDFGKIGFVFSGHFHRPQIKGNITYVGSPYQIDFGEEGDQKYLGFYITIYDKPTKIKKGDIKITPIDNIWSPRHRRVYYSKRAQYKKRHIYNNIVRPIIDEDIAPSAIHTWEMKLKGMKPMEIQPSTFTSTIESVNNRNLKMIDIPSDPVELMMVYLETLKIPDDIKKGTLKKLIGGVFEEIAKTQQLVKKNNHVFIDRVEFRNFFSFGNIWEELELKRGINLVMGPNGSGKTSLLESVLVGLYGKSSRNLNKEDVVNKTNQKHCEIKVTFQNNQGDEMRMERGVKPSYLRCYKNGELQPQEADLRIYQSRLENFLLSCDYRTWMNLQFISLDKNKTQPFLGLGRPQKRDFLEHILDLTLFKDVYTVIQNKLKIFEKKIAVHEMEMELYSRNIQENRKHLQNLTATYKQLKEGKDDRIADLESNLKRVKTNLEKKENKRVEVKDKLLDMEKLKRENIESSRILNKDIIVCNTTIKNKKKHMKEMEEAEECPWCFQGIDKKTQKTIMVKLTKETKERNRKIFRLEKEQEKIDKRISTFSDRMERQLQDLYKIENKIGIFKDRERGLNYHRREIERYSIEELEEQLMDLQESGRIYIAQLKSAEKKREMMEKYIRYFSYIRVLIGDENVKCFAISKIRPWLNKITNEYLERVGADYQIYFDENLDENFKLRNREDFKYENFSGGEMKRLDLIMIFTFQDILENLRGYYCDLMIFDEFIDSNLDADGKKKIMDIIKIKQKTKDLKVYIITHSTDISADDFSGFYKVGKRDHFSQIVEGEFTDPQ